MALPGVEGIGESALDDGRPCVLIFVVALTPELRRDLPPLLDGYPVLVEESGEIRAL